MSEYKGNPSLWNHRSETQRAREAAREAAAKRLAELEAEAAGIAIATTRRTRGPVVADSQADRRFPFLADRGPIKQSTAPQVEPIEQDQE